MSCQKHIGCIDIDKELTGPMTSGCGVSGREGPGAVSCGVIIAVQLPKTCTPNFSVPSERDVGVLVHPLGGSPCFKKEACVRLMWTKNELKTRKSFSHPSIPQ